MWTCIGITLDGEDQSVNEQTMIRRHRDEQIRVNKIMFADVNLLAVKDQKCRRYMFNYLEIVTTITVTLAIFCRHKGKSEQAR